MSTPGRSRTDTGDPFRGPASSLGLRGRIHNTARAITEPVSNEDLFNYFTPPASSAHKLQSVVNYKIDINAK